MALNIANCPRCGKVFAKGVSDVCRNCLKEIEKEYELCAEYLRENRGATIYEVSDATGVSVRQITKFIREGRISLMDNPNMGYPCESCGILIREGHLCGECRTRLTKQVQRVTEAMNQRESKNEAQREEHKPGTGYWIKKDQDKEKADSIRPLKD